MGGGNGDGVQSAGDDRAGWRRGWVVRVTRGVHEVVAVQRRGSKRRVKSERNAGAAGEGGGCARRGEGARCERNTML